MCSTAAAIAGLLINSAGNIAQGQASYEAGLFSQQLHEQRADIARKQGKIAEHRFLDESSIKAGARAAAYGVMGARLDEGSPADVMAMQMDEISREAALIRWQAEVDARQAMNQGAMARYQGKLDQYGSNVKATSSLLSGSANLIGDYFSKQNSNNKNTG